jgi:hypothetical protein
MSFVSVTKDVGKIQKSIIYWLSTILIALNKWVQFFIISMDLILFIFLYLKNTWKTTIVTSI